MSSNARKFARLAPDQVPWALVDFGGGSYTSMAANSPLPFDNIIAQNGSHYDTTNYRFTCPVAGVYSMTVSLLSQTDSNFGVDFRKNGTIFARNYVQTRAPRGTIEFEFAANDYIDMVTSNTLNQYQGTNDARYAWASFRLVG